MLFISVSSCQMRYGILLYCMVFNVLCELTFYLPTLFGIYLHFNGIYLHFMVSTYIVWYLQHWMVSTYIVWYLSTLYGIINIVWYLPTLFGIYLHCVVSNLHCMVSTYTVWYVSSYLHCMVSTYIALIFCCFFVYFYAICGTFKKSLIRTTWLQGLSLCNCFAVVVKCVKVQQNFAA